MTMSEYVKRVDQRCGAVLALLQHRGAVGTTIAWLMGYLDGRAGVTEPGIDADVACGLDATYLRGYDWGGKE